MYDLPEPVQAGYRSGGCNGAAGDINTKGHPRGQPMDNYLILLLIPLYIIVGALMGMVTLSVATLLWLRWNE